MYPKQKRLTPCTTRTIIFQRENSNYLIVCFTQSTLVFQHLFFSIANMFAVLYLWKTYVAKHGDKWKRTECPSKTCKTKSFLKAVTSCSDFLFVRALFQKHDSSNLSWKVCKSCVTLPASKRSREQPVIYSHDVLQPSKYRKIPKINPEAYIFQRPFLRGLFLEGLIYGGKFAFQNRLA